MRQSGTDTAERSLREGIIDTCLRMNREGINQGTSGNVSARWRDGMLITPSGIAYERLLPEDMVFINARGKHNPGQRPSSEWRFHLAILRSRPEIAAVVHTHSLHATALAICGMEIPALHYMIAAAGGPNIRCAPYATFGTDALSRNVVEALQDRSACLLANHGVVVTGPGLERALWLAGEVETLAHQYILSLGLGGPRLLPDVEIDRVVRKMRHYGPR
ncbi:Ribulose-5-phosphate 4-epimerase and related epimerase and aldolase [Thioalkalivibrio nitratireducens DSM 14787]|uniref:Ribulose-5-phosphate 4-epimerase and related epimerase and aldolase n=1 Tax=Thioalkalivibrio nitratireducens (strain DSM 14787 / UNIQEM 213 / ALEN2) TaxID=1255043 RepID=L0E1X1_THIND|nr:Ribulose-5-phosphate 4-epimerase and related epimerase and aldolase [Thioalkalivibrio nitratireducens DSM 14787]